MYPAVSSARARPRTSVKNTRGSVNVFPKEHAAMPRRDMSLFSRSSLISSSSSKSSSSRVCDDAYA